MMRTLVPVLALSACGRFGFATAADGGGAADDAEHDAASSDASGDAEIDAPASACKPSYRACDGFEGTALSAMWTPLGGVTIDPTFSHRGASSVKFRALPTPIGQDNYNDISNGAILPLADPTLYVRAWVRIGALPLNNMGMFAADQNITNGQESAVFLLPQALGVYSQFENRSRNNTTPPPTNTWFCVIWQLARATTSTGTLAITGDQPPVMLSAVQTDSSPPIRDLQLGIHFSGTTVTTAQPAMDVWMDDVIVSPTPVTCAD